MTKPKVVLDTNIYLSGIIFGGNARHILDLVIAEEIIAFTSLTILLEITNKLKSKFRWQKDQIIAVIQTISQTASLIAPKQKLRLSSYYDLSTKEREAFQISLTDKNKDKIVEILAYCLMPNHFHLILRQKQDNGISNFVANFSNSYTKYFNIKHKRPGSLFQGPFKAVHVETDEQLLHLSHYIHINPVSSGVIKPEKLEEYFWSSFPEYLGKSQLAICDTNWLSGFFSTKKKYKQFVFDQIGYAQKLESIKHLALE